MQGNLEGFQGKPVNNLVFLRCCEKVKPDFFIPSSLHSNKEVPMTLCSMKKKSALWILPLAALTFHPLPIPPMAHGSESKAVIRSCANAYEEPRPTSPYAMQRAPGPGGLMGGAVPPPVQSNYSAAQSEAEAPAEQKASGPDQLDVHQAGKKVDKNIRNARELYLSNDDSMSLASAQRIIYAIENFLPVYRNEIRPHEFLNYFHFKTDPVAEGKTFSVNFQTAPREGGETLTLAVQGKTLTAEQRRPAVMTLILDKSGSMAAQGKMEYLREGMEKLKSQFKNGDVINVVEFDHEVCNAVEGFQVGRDAMEGYDKTVKELTPRGSTDLQVGLVEGYKLAEKFYDAGKINRVILITDAIANTGQLDPELMASIGKYYDTKRIALSGIGVGLDFNDELLDTLTEKGKGAYLFLGMRDAIPRVFGTDFVSLLDTVARNVHFKATFPKGMHLDIFYGEEVSTEKAKVQPIHYFANTAQLFLLDLTGKAAGNEPFQLQIEFEDPVSGQAQVENFSQTVEQAQSRGRDNVAKARLLMAFATLLEKTSLPGNRPYSGWYPGFRQELSPEAVATGKQVCAEALPEMKKLSEAFSDQETQYATDLANKYCSRF
jgi:Ca-activated chloride channel family protein